MLLSVLKLSLLVYNNVEGGGEGGWGRLLPILVMPLDIVPKIPRQCIFVLSDPGVPRTFVVDCSFYFATKGLPFKISLYAVNDYRYCEFTDPINKNNVCLVFHDIRCIWCVQENRVVIVYVLQGNTDFGHVIFVFLVESSSVVCKHEELKLCVFFVIQDFIGFDDTSCWLDCEAVEK